MMNDKGKSKINSWYVITGGPSTGKTTVINLLHKLGYHTTIDMPDIILILGIMKDIQLKKLEPIKESFNWEF